MAKVKKTVLQAMSDPVNKDEITVSVPRNWKWARLIQLYKFIDYRGKTPKKTEKGVPLVTAKNVRKGYLDYTISEYISEEEYRERQTRGVSHRGDILFTTEAPMGYAAIADLDVFSAGQRVITFQKYDNTSWANNKFYYYYILSDWFQGELDKKKTGSTVSGIKAEKLMRFPIPIPPITEQQRIVDRIESLFTKLDEAKEKAQAVVDSFEDRKAAILYNAFKGMLTIEWRKARGTSINDWKTECLDNRFDITGGIQKTPSRKPNINPIPYITVANVYRNRIELSDIRYFEVFSGELDKLKLQYDDILVVEGNGSGNEIGRCAIWRNELPVCIHQNHIIRVRKKDNSVYPEYVLHYLNSPSGNRIMKEMAKTTAGLYNLSTGKIKSIPIPFAPIDEEIEIVRLIDFFLDKEQQAKEAAEQTLTQIDTMKKAILARALRGELGTNDPTDESAEELLKSIL